LSDFLPCSDIPGSPHFIFVALVFSFYHCPMSISGILVLIPFVKAFLYLACPSYRCVSGLFGGIGTGLYYTTTIGDLKNLLHRLKPPLLHVFLICILVNGVVVALVFLFGLFWRYWAGRSQYLLSWS
jgi:hypothetical protein